MTHPYTHLDSQPQAAEKRAPVPADAFGLDDRLYATGSADAATAPGLPGEDDPKQRLYRLFGPEALGRLAASRVAVFGLGGVGSWCMEALARSLQGLYPGKKLIFLTGVLADKDWNAMMGELLPLAKRFYTITPESPRALPAVELAAYLERKGGRAIPCGSVGDGLDQALAAAEPEDVVCVCGSLYMIGEARHLLGLC